MANGGRYSPVIILGAPRSGTNMLRDTLTSVPGVSTWPCDEINYIWRHGNLKFPFDDLAPERARPEVRSYIRSQFDWVARRYNASFVVEKTCANSLRVEFVAEVVPEARYIVIYRDGIDAAASAMKRWKAGIEYLYLLRKARFVPRTDIPFYLKQFIRNRWRKITSKEKRLFSWGPQTRDMKEFSETMSLEEICIWQWKKCVDATDAALQAMDQNKIYKVKYEELVDQPQREFRNISAFLSLPDTRQSADMAKTFITNQSVGKGRAAFTTTQTEKMYAIAGETLERHGYA